MAKKNSGVCVLLFLAFLSAFAGAYCGLLLARESLTKEFLQMLSKQTDPRFMNSGNSATEQTQGTENQREGVSYVAEECDTAMKECQVLKGAVPVRPRENCFTKSDRALKSAGVSMDLQRSSRSAWYCRVAWVLCASNVLETFEQLDTSPGYCWPMKTSNSQIVFNLPTEVQPTAVTVQHTVDTTLWHISSAPRDFAVFGLDKEGENEELLGQFTYNIREELSQTFELQTETPRAFWHIKLVTLSNWGNAGHTCIYRVQVHGKSAGMK
ncbi:sperm-associated antigen 4 protein-like [Lagopus muta]|uniref:sperm-associated antigen 4 protein-like n=1 Tax=Lagopus muta TaxID=64668 RepID=UPI0020A18C6A|nr:sperm-associated antigen 4 protein-like [Lagopus muta]